MAIYTLSSCLLENLKAGKRYITDLLMVFTQEANPFKVALDKTNRVMDTYEQLGQQNEFISTWLNLMSYQPTNFETINVDTKSATNREELFLKVCASTKIQQKMIVYSHESWENYSYEGEKIIFYNQVPVRVYDRDEAILELNQTNSGSVVAYDSIVTVGQSSISDTKIKQTNMEQKKHEGDINIFGGQIGAVGNAAHSDGSTFNQAISSKDSEGLLLEIRKIKQYLIESEGLDSSDEKLLKANEIESFIKESKYDFVKDALVNAGSWIYTIIEKLGLTLMAKLIIH